MLPLLCVTAATLLLQAVVNEHTRGDVEALQLENQRLARLVAQLRCGDDTLAAENAALRERLEHVRHPAPPSI